MVRSEGSRTQTLPTDDDLLDAALAVFAERGYRQATMEAIAERARSTKPTLYAHFGGKNALYQAVFAREVNCLRTWVLAAYDAAEELPLEQLVRGYVMPLFDYAVARPESFRILFSLDAADGDTPLQQAVVDAITDRVQTQVRQYLTAHGWSPDPATGLIAAILVALTGGAARHVQRSGEISPAAAGELATSLIMAAIHGLDPAALDAVNGS